VAIENTIFVIYPRMSFFKIIATKKAMAILISVKAILLFEIVVFSID